tara:strand:- start:3870 stop:4916 length:1047 start_codon:yes stop_codon:yes gene_type:complete
MNSLTNASILDTIGNTPIVKLQHIGSEVNAEIYAKLEGFNPGGSIKDRPAVYMCQQAAKQGLLKPGGVIVESTSGNTGIGLCLYANVHQHPCIFVMTDKQSQEKIRRLQSLGASVVLCPSNAPIDSPISYYSVAQRLARELGGLHINQYQNQANPDCHYHQTGPEIIRQTQGEFDALVAGVGTGGTISGIGRYLKEHYPHIKIFGVDCQGSVFSHYYHTGQIRQAKTFLMEGLGGCWIPPVFDKNVVNGFEVVNDKNAFAMTQQLLIQEGIYAGGSSGGAITAAIQLAQRCPELTRILAILPDSGDRYASRIYHPQWMNKHQLATPFPVNAYNSKIIACLDHKDVRLA